MSAKKSQKTEGSQTITLTAELQKTPEAKALLKRISEMKERSELEGKLAPIVKVASETLGVSFKTFAQVARFIAKKTAVAPRAARLSEEQKNKIVELNKSGKGHKEIAAEVGCKITQVSSWIFNSKKK